MNKECIKMHEDVKFESQKMKHGGGKRAADAFKMAKDQEVIKFKQTVDKLLGERSQAMKKTLQQELITKKY